MSAFLAVFMCFTALCVLSIYLILRDLKLILSATKHMVESNGEVLKHLIKNEVTLRTIERHVTHRTTAPQKSEAEDQV